MKVQAFCEEKGLRSFLGVFGYAESKNQCWQAEKWLLHHLICIFPRWPPKLRKTSIAANWYMFRIPNCYKIIQELRGGRYRTCIGQSQQTVKYSSRAPGQGACLKGMSRTITMQGFRFAAISDVEKTKLGRKNFQSQWTVTYRSRAPG